MNADNFNQEFNDTQSLNSIYSQLAINEEGNFDETNENKFITDIIKEIFDKEFLLIESKILENESELIHSSFVKLILSCKELKYKNVGNIFIVYCDYFDLNYIKIYDNFHPNIKKIITNAYIKLVGVKFYESKKHLLEDTNYKQSTIFDLFSKKEKEDEVDEPFTEDEIKLQKSLDILQKAELDECFSNEEIQYQINLEILQKKY